MTRETSNNVFLFLVALIGLTAITWAIGLLDIQYKSESTIAFNSGFPGNSEQWKLAGDPTNITLSANSVTISRISEQQSYAMREFPLPPPDVLLDRQLRVRGAITTLKQASSTTFDDVAAYMIWFQDQNNESIQYTTVQALTGDFAQYRAERIVSVPNEARSFVTVLINRKSDGAFELTDANVTVVETTLLYRIISPAVFFLWICLVLVAMVWLVINGGFRVGIAVGVLLSLTLIGILIPDSVTTHYIFPAYKQFAKLLSLDHSEPLGVYYKIGHFLFFFAVSLVLILNRERLQLSVSIVILFMLVFAIATEGLQLHMFNRSTRLSDVGIDIFGIAVAALIGLHFCTGTQKSIHTNDDPTG